MTEFWESAFKDKQEMWGSEPADSAITTANLFLEKGLKNILIPGFGYGRNAKVFTDKGFKVTGIEISDTAISLAKKHFGDTVTVHHGGVGAMPFDQKLYDGIFCYALIHLLNEDQRAKLINDCYEQLSPGGYMVFVAIATSTTTYGEGTKLGGDWFETKHGVKLFYYKPESIQKEFGHYGLTEAIEINEPAKHMANKASQKFWEIVCKKTK